MDTPEASGLLEQLTNAGQRRAAANRHSPEGLAAIGLAYDDIRALTPEAVRLGVTKRRVAEAVGVSPVQLYNILTGHTKTVQRPRNPEAVDVASQLQVLAEWLRDPGDYVYPPEGTVEALEKAMRLLVAS